MFLSSDPCLLTLLTAFISARSPASQRLSHLTEWREADAPEFSEPLTFSSRPSSCNPCLHAAKHLEGISEGYLKNSLTTEEPKKKKNPSIFSFSSTLWGALLRVMRKGMASLRNQRRGLQKLFYVCFSVSVVYSYNIDLEHPLVFRGPESSFFGFSVLEHYHDSTRW